MKLKIYGFGCHFSDIPIYAKFIIIGHGFKISKRSSLHYNNTIYKIGTVFRGIVDPAIEISLINLESHPENISKLDEYSKTKKRPFTHKIGNTSHKNSFCVLSYEYEP